MVVCSPGSFSGYSALCKRYRYHPRNGKPDCKRLADWDHVGILYEYSGRKFSGVHIVEAGDDLALAGDYFCASAGILYHCGVDSKCDLLKPGDRDEGN